MPNTIKKKKAVELTGWKALPCCMQVSVIGASFVSTKLFVLIFLPLQIGSLGCRMKK